MATHWNLVIRPIAFVFASIIAAAVATAAQRPNIVFVIADDCTFRDIGCYGGQALTPHMDALAGQGMRFTRCFQAAPMCSPTRHNLYTGQYPVKSGAYPNHTMVAPETESVVQYLGKLGYHVGQSGKSHVHPKSVFDWDKIPGKSNPDFDRVDDWVGKRVDQSEPFCLLLCSNEPHTPWDKGDPTRYPPDQIELPPNFVDTPETRRAMSRYLAEITYFDSQIGQTIEILRKYAIEENTLVVVVSEQGSSFPFAKWTCYDSGLQSACIVRWPGKVAAGSVNPAMIEYVDFLPTFIEVAGGHVDPVLDGKSLVDVFAGKQTHKSHVFGEMTTRGIIRGSPSFGIRSVRSQQYKYIWNFTPEVEFSNVAMTSPEFQSWEAKANAGDGDAAAKVLRYRRRPAIELYDVVADPLETNNLADDPALADVRSNLRAVLDRWMQACGDRGQATEMAALERMPSKKKRKSKTTSR